VGVRGRSRLTETGGSDVVTSAATPVYGSPDPIAERPFVFRPVNQGRVRQMSFMLGYTGELAGLGSINLGLQKARYRATNLAGATGTVTRSRDNPWLYNATVGFDLSPELSAYIGSETGLEDSGTAPEIATNRNEQLPSTRSTQYEAGLRWKHGGAQLVVSAFQITKPNFAFDPGLAFVRQGDVRHRGIETSFSGHFGDRLHVVAGAVLMQPRVLGAAGGRPAGTPSAFARLYASYRTDVLGGLTPTLALVYTGSRAVTLRSAVDPAAPQLMAPGSAVVDLGLRQQLKIGSIPASVRLVVYNVLDDQSWKVVAANTLYPDERRRVSLSLAADF
jgi:iron complex outermembrane receptor protein